MSTHKRRPLGCLLALFVVLAIATTVDAEEIGAAKGLLAPGTERERVVVEGQELLFLRPAGYCSLDLQDETEAASWRVIERLLLPSNKLLAAWFDCDEMEIWQGGNSAALERYVLIMAPINKDGTLRLARMTRAYYIAEMTKVFERPDLKEKIAGSLRKHFEGKSFESLLDEEQLEHASADMLALAGAEYEALRQEILASGDLGFFPAGADEVASYAGYAVQEGAVMRAGIGALTIVKRVPLSIVVYDLLGKDDVYPALRADARALALATITINDDLETGLAERALTWLWTFDGMREVLAAAIGGAAVGAVFGLLFWVKRRLFG